MKKSYNDWCESTGIIPDTESAEAWDYQQARIDKLLKVSASINSYDLKRCGGKWLGAARSYLQHNVKDGDIVTWNSNQHLNMTVTQIEDMASEIAAAAIKEFCSKEVKSK